MTEPDDPSERPPGEGHGLVEEIRHEIHEAVEHVPKQVRWTVGKLVLLVGLSLAALLVVAILSVILYYANRTELVARELTLFLNHTLAARSDVRVEVSDIQGNPFQQVRLLRARVVFADGSGSLLEAPAIQLGYSPLSFLRRDGRTVEIVMESPVVTLRRKPDGGWRLPTWATSGPTAKPGSFDVKFVLHDGTVLTPNPSQSVRGLEVDALASTGQHSRAVIRRLQWRQGPFELRDLRLEGEISSGDSVRFAVKRLTTRDLALTASGGWRKGSKERTVHLELERVRWRWIARVAHNGAFDVPGEGSAVIDARGSSAWGGRFTTRLTWNDLAMTGVGGLRWESNRLLVQPLLSVSKAGVLDGHAAWSNLGWEVGGRVGGGQPSAWGAIGIPGWPSGKLAGDFTYRVDTRRHISHGALEAHLVGSELAGWRVDDGTVRADFPPVGTRTFSVLASRRGGTFGLEGGTTEQGWRGDYRVHQLPLDEWPDGRASGIRGMLADGAGTVEASPGRLDVTGELAGGATDWLGVHAEHWRLGRVAGRLLPTPDLKADARLASVLFLGVHFDSVASPVHLGDRTLDLIGLRALAGDTVVTVAGRSDWNGASWQVLLDRAEARSHQFDWVADPPLHLGGDAAGVTFNQFQAHDGDAQLLLRGRWAVPGGSYDWTARATRLDLSRLGLPPELKLGGTADAVLEVRGPSGDPAWTCTALASRPASFGHRGDSLELAIGGSRGRLEVRQGRFALGSGELEASGRFERTAAPWPDSLTGTAVWRWLAGAASWDGSLVVRKFPIERVTDLYPAAAGWAGVLDGKLGVGGSPARPELDLAASVQPLTWHAFALERLQAEGRYAAGRLDIRQLQATRGTLHSRAHGTLPMELAMDRPVKLLDQPMEGTMEVRDGDLALLPLLVPQIAGASGRIEFDARLAGTPVHPDLQGRGHVEGASLRLAGRDEVLEDVRAFFRLEREKVTLDSLVARQGEHGRVRSSGSVTLEGLAPKSYRFGVSMRDFTASEPGVYAVRFDGDFVVTDGPRVRGQWLPMITGSATILRAVVLVDFANQSEAQQLAASNPPLYWLYRVDLTATSNLHWQPPDGDIEFTADLTAEQTPNELRLYGEMKSLRGTYYFLSNRFDVGHADLTFDNVSGVNPVIDAEAVTRVVPLGGHGTLEAGSESRDQPHDVTVQITGRGLEPVMSLSSKPSDWDEPEILRQLTVGRFVSSTGVAQGDPFDNYLTRAINRTLSSEMSRVFKGYVNEWVIDREHGGLFAGQGDVFVGVGSQVTPNLMVRYRQRLPGLGREVTTATSLLTPFERDLEAEYRLNRFFLITSELSQRRNLSGGPSIWSSGPDFNINLKARWEY
jgi:hypothetical protein